MIDFTCPTCGSYKFGSIRNDDNTFTRYCKGMNDVACKFIFHENLDYMYLKADQYSEQIVIKELNK